MLTQLTINNFAIVRSLDIEFHTGMSVITGETGAGKSIAIDALGVCLGQRTENTMLREGQERADICATFQLAQSSPALMWLQQQDLQDLDSPQQCLLRRIINQDGRSKAFINGIPVAASQLKELGQYLIHINGQHASQRLLKSDEQLRLLDNFCTHTHLLNQMQERYQTWRSKQQEIQQYQQKLAENEARKQLLHYQVNELEEFNLRPNEYEELEQEQKRLANSEELTHLSQSALQLLSENETVNIGSLLYRTTQYIDDLCQLDSRYQNVANLLQEALIQVQEATSEVQHLSCDIEQDPHLLNEIEQRMGQALQLARKHQVQPENLVALQQQLQTELAQLTQLTDNEQHLIEQEQRAYAEMQACATALYQSRQQGAKKLAQQVTQSIKTLAMENAEFAIEIDHQLKQTNSNGADAITFTLRSNLGQTSQPLAKIASGGELSRIALAIQVLTSDQSAIPTLIFDEVDVGISGATASVVGKLLRQLGQRCQVICVTHLPQVASYGQHHFNVEKLVIEGKTETKMTALSDQQRIKAVARLLGSSQITDNALANAEEMLNFGKSL